MAELNSPGSPPLGAQDVRLAIARPIIVRRLMLAETCVSTLINAFVPAGIIWLLGVAPPTSLTGRHGLLPAIVAATVLPIFLMTIALTHVLRRRIASRPMLSAEPALERGSPMLSLPLLPRALGLTLLGLVVLAPAAVGFLYGQGLIPMTPSIFALFNISYGALIGIVLTPLIVWAALAESRIVATRVKQ